MVAPLLPHSEVLMETQARRGYDPHEDERTLHRLGYAQVLFREMGGFSNFAISFTIISILAGCLTSYYIAFQWGGPIAVTWGLAASRDLLHHRLARDGRG